jgi:hypothetical protein
MKCLKLYNKTVWIPSNSRRFPDLPEKPLANPHFSRPDDKKQG